MSQTLTSNNTVIEKKRLRDYIKPFALLFLSAVLFLGLFYYSCGEELYSRESNGSIKAFPATNDVGELIEGRIISQTFKSDTDIIKSVGVMLSNYGRDLNSNVTISLSDGDLSNVIASRTIPSNELGVNQYTMLDFTDIPLENMRYHVLTVSVSSDGLPGNSPTVLYNVEDKIALIKDVSYKNGFAIDGNTNPGALCITLQGRDNVWTGDNYWKISGVALIMLALTYWIAVWRHLFGKRDLIFSVLDELKKYKFLIKQLVNRDFKVRYKRSVLGVFWSLLNPTLMMLVQYIVFSKLFKFDIANYPLYLLSGTIVFNFFTEGVSQALTSIVGNASLITKVYMPKYVYPITRVLSSSINLIMSLLPLILVALITGENFTKAYLMLPYILVCLIIFVIGFGTMMSSLMVFFRDMQFLWGVLSMMWMYLTPLFYPISIIPDVMQKYMALNPMIHYISAVRSIVLDGVTPQPIIFLKCTLIAFVMLFIGLYILKTEEDKFIFYI